MISLDSLTKICKRAIENLSEVFFPETGGCAFCSNDAQAHGLCRSCLSLFEAIEISDEDSVFKYEGIAMRAVLGLKFGGKRYLAKPMGELMREKAKRIHYDYIVPVPLHKLRMTVRGFNQSGLIAKSIDEESVLDALSRNRRTKPQTRLGVRERQNNVRGAFAIKKGYEDRIAGKSILLIDDVLTTGSTSAECFKALIAAGAEKVYILTFTKANRE